MDPQRAGSLKGPPYESALASLRASIFPVTTAGPPPKTSPAAFLDGSMTARLTSANSNRLEASVQDPWTSWGLHTRQGSRHRRRNRSFAERNVSPRAESHRLDVGLAAH